MNGLKVTLSKLEKYCKQQGGYDLDSDGGEITLVFVPSFPEAVDKGDSEGYPKIVFHGKLDFGIVSFYKVEVEDTRETREKDIGEAELAYKSWLDFIEENY